MLKHQKAMKWLLIFIIFLLGLRISAPYLIEASINHEISQIPNYQGRVNDVSLSLIKASISLKGINIKKQDKSLEPIINIKCLTIAMSWPALMKAHLYTQVFINQPKIYFIQYKTTKAPAPKVTDLWQELREKMLMIKVNDITINQGELHYLNQQEQPPFDIQLKNINAKLTGLQQNASSKNPLPAKLSMSAQTLGDAEFNLDLAFNAKAKTPTFKLESQLEHLKLKNANNFLQAYTDLQASQGEFNLYLEAAAKNQKLTAYAKPFFEDVKVELPKEKEKNRIKRVYKNAVNWLSQVLENNQTEKGATKIEISGDINDPSISLWSAVINLLQNAFLQAFLPGIDKSIKF